MLIVRDIFTAKPGQASKLANLFKRAMGTRPNVRILTDYVSNYNTVIMEMEVESLTHWEELIRQYMAEDMGLDAELAAEFKSYTELWKTGKREVLKIVD